MKERDLTEDKRRIPRDGYTRATDWDGNVLVHVVEKLIWVDRYKKGKGDGICSVLFVAL